jgi:hypothetical protein
VVFLTIFLINVIGLFTFLELRRENAMFTLPILVFCDINIFQETGDKLMLSLAKTFANSKEELLAITLFD